MKLAVTALTVLSLVVGVNALAADKYLHRIDNNEAPKTVEVSKVKKAPKAKDKASAKVKNKSTSKSAAQKASKISAKPKAEAPKKNMSRDVVFDGSTVHGRYHSAGEAVATVETEKKLNDLIGSRKDFKDRLAVENARLKKDESR